MDARLEAAIEETLARAPGGGSVDAASVRDRHPDHWRGVMAFLAFQGRLAAGTPARRRVGPYVLLRRLGRGGAGTVYLAEAPGAEGPARVALKLVHGRLAERPEFVRALLRDAAASRLLDHPNVARTLDAGTSAGSGSEAWVVTEYVERQNLRGLL